MRASVKWTICAVAAMGFLFDIYVVLVGPLILQPALTELGSLKPGTPEYRDWAGYLFWIPPLVGGFCGLWGGYLADRFGRRRILTYSILVYAFSATASGLAGSLESLLLFRTLSFAGTCVEFVAAVAWLAEIFPDPKTREAVLGYTQAFASLGGVLTAGAFYVANRWGLALPAIYGSHSAWRYALIAGVAPAIPLAIIRPFLPGIAAMGAPARGRHIEASQRARIVQPRIPPRHHRHRAAVRLRLWRGVRHHPAIAADHAGLAGGGATGAGRARASDFERARHSGNRRIGRTHRAGRAWR